MVSDAEMRRRLRRELERKYSKETMNASKAIESFIAWLAEAMRNLVGAVGEGVKSLFDWLRELFMGRR